MEIDFERLNDYFLAKGTGKRTFEGILSLLRIIRDKADETKVYRFLIDLRNTFEGFTTVDKYEIGKHVGEIFGHTYRVAVLMQESEITGLVENSSVNRGAVFFIVTSDEARAVAWVLDR